MSRLCVTVPKRFIHVEKVDGFGTEPSLKVIPSGMLSTRTILWRKFGSTSTGDCSTRMPRVSGECHPPISSSYRHVSPQDLASPPASLLASLRTTELSRRLKRKKMKMKRVRRTVESNAPREHWDREGVLVPRN